jgi:small subunit ribosomal protein S16
MGKNNRQTFRLVVTDKRNPRDGKYLEMLGWYNPFEANEKNTSFKVERIEYWLQKGAQISENAKAIIKKTAPQIIKSLNDKKMKTKTKKSSVKKIVKAQEADEAKTEKKPAAKAKKTTKAKAKK